MTTLQNIKFLNAGYCSQLSRWTGVRSWRWSKFYAVIVYFEHPEHGRYLIDTGYGNAFWDATRSWPFRSYRWLVPATIDSENGIASSLKNEDFDLSNLDGTFISHFHPDHIAGIASLPRVPLLLRHEPLDSLFRLSPNQQMRHGFVPDLFPKERLRDIRGIPESSFGCGDVLGGSRESLRVLDYWGDGSLILVDLPGHAPGHTGYLMNTYDGPMFYIVDAAWSIDVLLQQQPLPWFSRGLQGDYEKYWQTQQELVKLHEKLKIPLLACHCPRTQAYVANAN